MRAQPGMFTSWGDAGRFLLLCGAAAASSLGFIALCLFAFWVPAGIGMGALGVVMWREGGGVLGRLVSLGVLYWAGSILLGGMGVI